MSWKKIGVSFSKTYIQHYWILDSKYKCKWQKRKKIIDQKNQLCQSLKKILKLTHGPLLWTVVFKKNRKIFKTDFFLKTLLLRISQKFYKKYHAQKNAFAPPGPWQTCQNVIPVLGLINSWRKKNIQLTCGERLTFLIELLWNKHM